MTEENFPIERPFECSECKKPIAFRYTEIVGDNLTQFHCCADCPVLKRKLAAASEKMPLQQISGLQAGLACGSCGTTLDTVRMGSLLGCSSCYDVFEEVILNELQSARKIPSRINLVKKTMPIHIGRSPGEKGEINPAMRLLALNEALEATLKREDYEQAALLRDQIRALKEEEGHKGEAHE